MSETKQDLPEIPKSGIKYTKADGFVSDYANNSQLLASNWDLKITFGQLEQSIGPNNVVQTVAITLPWSQAKVLHYFLTLHLIGHEAELGRIIIPTGIIGEYPEVAPPGLSEEAFQEAKEFVEQFMTENPEAKPRKP
jgi:hypothetical protein